ncbi:MAG: hydroxyacid-oxoacid transhydrogenase [Pseudomonadota bacterium]
MGCQYFDPCHGGADSFSVVVPRVTFGRGCLSEVGQRAAWRGYRRVAVFTDPGLRDGPYVDTVLRALAEKRVDSAVFDALRIEPDDTTTEDGGRFLADGGFDAIVSVGGGSVIDTAKGAAILAQHGGTLEDYFAPPIGRGHPVPGPVLPHIACPTTSGTGSECTSITVIRFNKLDCKFVLSSPYLLPIEALVDPVCIDTVPSNVVASTGFDLLSHALECYTARAYTRWDKVADSVARPLLQGANPWSDLAAREALDIAGTYLARGVADSSDTEARDKLAWGATLAGMAFGNSGTHLPHAMSYGVTHYMNEIGDLRTDGYGVDTPFVPHGISVIVNAPAIFRYCAAGAPERHLEAAAHLHADQRGAGPDDAGEVLSSRLIELMRATGMPNGLRALGFDDAHCQPMAVSSVRQARAIGNAPRESNVVDMENMYRDALAYW